MTSAVPKANRYLPSVKAVPGKDFSDFRDRDEDAVSDPEQVVAFDGLGGVRDSFDYSGSRINYPLVAQDRAVDALGASNDALYDAVIANRAALLFSVETDPEILFERATGYTGVPGGFGVWATADDIDDMNNPIDTDALEVWGDDDFDDSTRYSLAGDPEIDVLGVLRKVAVWQYSPILGVSDPFIYTSALAEAMDKQFGGPGDGPLYGQLVERMDVDAIMVRGMDLLFSIRPIDVQPAHPLFFDGGEIFVYTPGAATRFLDHGGHLWDTLFDVRGTFGVNHENIDALEAIANPEPAGAAMGLVATALLLIQRRRLRRPAI